MIFIKHFGVILILLLSALSFNSHAENMKKMGSMDVHYMALGATFLTPEIAKAYGIERSRFNALINISVLDNSIKGTPAKVVTITGSAQNLAGQNKSLAFEQVKEGQSIYYLAQVNYRNNETIRFKLTISDGKETHQLEFSQKFYTD
jgi:hypothetical protein